MNLETTLTRYLRNFDPINQSLFNVPNNLQDQPRDNAITEQDLDNTDEKVEIKSQKSQRSCMSPQSKDIREVVKRLQERQQELLKENRQQQNKLHYLAEHVSALQFENEQITQAMRKSNRLYKSMKTSREGSKMKLRSCDRCLNLGEEVDKVTRLMESFIGQFSCLYLKQNDESHPMCDNFRKLLTKYQKVGSKSKRESDDCGIFTEISEWMLVLFEQIDFQNQLNDAFRERVNILLAEGETYADKLKQVESERNQALAQLEALNDKINEEQEDQDERLTQIIRLCVDNIEARHKILDFLSYTRKKQAINRNILKMCRNLQDFQLNYGNKTVQNGFNSEVRFKQLMINKEKDELARLEQVTTRIYKSIICNMTVREKQNSLRTALQSRQSKIHSHKNSSTSMTTSVGGNRLFDQILKNDQTSEIRQSELSRQNSLLHLKKKIQQADSLSRMMSNKNIRM